MKFIKRVLAALLSGCLCLVVLLGAAVPNSSAAEDDTSAEISGFSDAAVLADFSPGQTVNTKEGGPYTSVTGHKYAMMQYSFMRYYSDGTKKIINNTKPEGHTEVKYYVGNTFAYCIESGQPFNGGNYVSSSPGVSDYITLLQMHVPAAPNNIMLAMLYGYNQSAALPTTSQIGCNFNADDFAFATQIIIWEFQSGIRTSPTKIQNLSYGGRTIYADNYVKWINGYPAKNCYNWILSQMQKHNTRPSFSGGNTSAAPVQTMKYNPQTGKYSVTLTDTNNTGCDLKFPATSGITVSRNGNQYTFSTSQVITNPVTLTVQKQVPRGTGNFLIWSNGKDQTLATGVEDPVKFFVKLKTEPMGEVKVVKQTTDHTGKVVKLSGAVFDLMVKDGTSWTKATTLVESKTGEYTLPTNAQGYYSYTLQVGKTYKVVETAAPSGVVNTGWESEEFTYAAGGKYSYTCNNEIPTGGIKLEKTDDLAGFPLEGAVFEVTAAQDITYTLNGTTYTRFHKGDVVGQMTTDASGMASMSGLYYGTYTVTEIQAPDGYHILIPAFTVTVAAPADYQSTTVYPSASIGVATYDGVTSTPDGGAQLTNRPMLANLTIHKSGQGDKDLSGVELQLVDTQGNVVTWSQQEDGSYAAMLVQDGQWVPAQGVDTVITDAQGRVELVNIPYGTYTLREIQTEAGYQLLPNPVTITLPYEVAGEKDSSGGEVYYSNGTNYYYHLTYDLRNTLVYRLPATGGYAVWLIGAGLALAALCVTGLAVHRKQKKNKEENNK